MKDDEKIPEDKKVDHLILLVGGNPLPNAVAGRLLVRDGGRITLVHSDETEPIADDLKTWFDKYHISNVTSKIVDESKADNIHTEVQNIINKDERTGLNYTGGTKAMAVHAHRAFYDMLQNKAIKMSSYLDSHKLRLIFDDGLYYDAIDNLPTSFELQDFIDLHTSLRINPCNPPLTQAWLPDTTYALAKGWQRSLSRTWKEWYIDHVKPLKQPRFKHELKDSSENLVGWRYQYWQDEERLKTTNVPFPEGEIGRRLNEELIAAGYPSDLSDLNIGQAYNSLVPSPDILPDCPSDLETEEFCAWLEAKWLEHYVASCLEKSGLFDSVYIGVETVLGEVDQHTVCFEMDVVGVRGYQLFAISCSTGGNKKLMKQKLFEVTMRARQLGGDEARIALVCTSDKPIHIQSESRATIDKHIRVFGAKHLGSLQTALTAWVEGRDS